MMSLTGCGRKLVSRGGYPWLPDLVVVNTVMQSADNQHWVRAMEIAVVPGTGQVCVQRNGLTGSVSDIRPFPKDGVRALSGAHHGASGAESYELYCSSPADRG
jgi:hypothetical protein